MRRKLPDDIAARPNVWLGTSVETAEYLWRVDKLLSIDCAGPRWVSYEPALGPVNFRAYLDLSGIADARGRVEWIIVGGESGARARPFDPAWARSGPSPTPRLPESRCSSSNSVLGRSGSHCATPRVGIGPSGRTA